MDLEGLKLAPQMLIKRSALFGRNFYGNPFIFRAHLVPLSWRIADVTWEKTAHNKKKKKAKKKKIKRASA